MKDFLRKWQLPLLSLALFIGFKILYPYPDFFQDSLNYIQWGLDGLEIAFRPLGYTQFLMVMKSLPGSTHFVIVFMQWALHVVAAIFFCRTVFRIWPLPRPLRIAVYAFTLFNPLAYFLLNLVNPDSLFISLTAIWLAAMLRFFFVAEKRWWMLGIQAVAFICLFHLRYNALYYPFFGAAAVLLCALTIREKLIYAAASVLVFAGLYNAALSNAEEQVGARLLSGFGGWAMANNALHIYRVQAVDSGLWEEPEEQLFGQAAMSFKDSMPNIGGAPTDQFLWNKNSPLKQYLFAQLGQGRYPSYLEGWWQVSELYNDCGTKLIRRYPGAFLRAYFWPNLKSFVMPPPEAFLEYDANALVMSPAMQDFLDYQKPPKTPEVVPGLLGNTVKVIRYVYALLTPLTALAALGLIGLYILAVLRRRRWPEAAITAGFVLSAFYFATVFLLTFAHPIMMRYVSLPFLYCAPLIVLFLQQLRTTRGRTDALDAEKDSAHKA
jgi:hypothetical protein